MHYLCPIEGSDKAEDLFMKGIIGAVKTYKEFFEMNDFEIKGIVQKRSFKYVRNIDWTIINDFKLNRFNKLDRMKIYKRKEQIINYTLSTYNIQTLYSRVLKEILG